MINALIVTVFACIGLSYEYIVPWRNFKLVNETNSIFENNKEQSEEEIETKNEKLTKKSNNLKSGQNLIEDKELYDQSNGEQSNISQRSFIFINQKFRKPLFGPLYSPLYSPSEFLTDSTSVVSHKKTLNNILGGNPVVYVNSRNSLSSVNAKKSHVPLQFTFPVIEQDKKVIKPEVLDKMYNYNEISQIAVKKTGDTKKSQYVALIKPYMLRSIHYVTPKEEKDTIWPNVDTYSYSKYQKEKKPEPYIPSELKQLSPVNPVIYETDNFGFLSPFRLRSNQPEEIDILNKINPRNDYNKDFIKPREENSSNMLIKKMLNDNDEVNQLLDRYIADPITEPVSNEMFHPNFECEFNDCNSQSKAQIKNKLIVRDHCKCGKHPLDIKKLNEFGTADTMKIYATTTEALTSSKSSEINEYGHLSSDETNIDNVVRDFLQ